MCSITFEYNNDMNFPNWKRGLSFLQSISMSDYINLHHYNQKTNNAGLCFKC